jgi:hypothetical protein
MPVSRHWNVIASNAPMAHGIEVSMWSQFSVIHSLQNSLPKKAIFNSFSPGQKIPVPPVFWRFHSLIMVSHKGCGRYLPLGCMVFPLK